MALLGTHSWQKLEQQNHVDELQPHLVGKLLKIITSSYKSVQSSLLDGRGEVAAPAVGLVPLPLPAVAPPPSAAAHKVRLGVVLVGVDEAGGPLVDTVAVEVPVGVLEHGSRHLE